MDNVARAAVLCSGWLIATAAPVLAQTPTIAVTEYRTDPRGNRQLFVGVAISSTYEVNAVVATVAGRQRQLTKSDCVFPLRFGCLPGWSGLMDLAGVQRGPQILTVTITDVLGNTGSGSHAFDWDDLPTLAFVEPIEGTLARPEAHILATCEDDDPAGCTFSVTIESSIPSETVAQGVNLIETTISLAKFVNRSVEISLSTRDSAGHFVTERRKVTVRPPSSFQREVGSVRFQSVPGFGCTDPAILDADATRILFEDKSSSGVVFKIRDRATGMQTSIPLASAATACDGELTPGGAIFIRHSRVFEFRNGTVVDLNSTAGSSSALQVAGKFATWNEYDLPSFRRLLYDTSTASLTVFDRAGDGEVAANGDLVYTRNENVMRVRGGVEETIAATPASETNARTDGVNVVYASITGPVGKRVVELFAYTASGATHSLAVTDDGSSPVYVLNGGWIAFTRRTSSGIAQVWLRNPGGQETQVTFFSTGASVRAVAPNGDLVYSGNDTTYLRNAETGAAIDVGPLPSALAEFDRDWLAGQRWWYAVGRSLFELSDTAGCSYSLSQPDATLGTEGGTGRVAVVTTAACGWTATTTAPWVSVISGSPGQDDGIVGYRVQANTSTLARTATLAIAGQPVSIVQAGLPDADADTLPDFWESQTGLNASSATGDNGPNGDPDKDGKTNLQEYEAGTHPRGFVTRYFAEGATSTFFDTQFALANPGAAPAKVLLRFLTGPGGVAHQWVDVPAMSRRTVNAKAVPNLTIAELSTVVESDEVVVVDRTMTWDQTGYGAHTERGIEAPALTWYLAEGATHSGFNLFYLLQNPSATAVQAEVTYLRPAPAAPIVKTYIVPAASRFNIWVNQEGAGLASTDVSAVVRVTNAIPIIVERAMYLDTQGKTFGAGHESAGVTAPATEWFLAEGATGSYFDLFVLIANPNAAAAAIEARFLLPSGTVITRTYQVAANSRFNILVDTVDPALADTAVSTTIRSTNGVAVIAERAMWWPGPTFSTWQEAHNSPGSTVTGTKWALAEGEVGGPLNRVTYILVANTSNLPGSASVTLLFEDGTTASKTVALQANSRFNVDVGSAFPAAVGKRFSAIVESLGATPAQLVVERAMYWNAQGIVWAAGTNAIATRLQ